MQGCTAYLGRAMIKTKLWWDGRTLRDDRGQVKVRISLGGSGAFVGTGVWVRADEWDVRAERVLGRSAIANRYNETLARIKTAVDSALMDGALQGTTWRTASEVKRYVEVIVSGDASKGGSDREGCLFFPAFDAHMNSRNAAGTREVYNQTRRKVARYVDEVLSGDVDDLRFEDITKGWLVSFEAWLGETSTKNARNVHLRNIRAVFNSALDDELITVYPFRRFDMRVEPTRKRSLSVEKLRELLNYPIDEWQVIYRDLFLLDFALIGINSKDLLTARKDQVVDGRLEYRRAKTGRLYSIKLEPIALDIIERYSGSSEWLLSVLDNYKDYRNFSHHWNDALKTIGTHFSTGKSRYGTPLCPEISTYWARHTWATIASKLEIPKETIARALGHGQSSVTDIYIDFDESKVDDANKKVIDYVLQDKK